MGRLVPSRSSSDLGQIGPRKSARIKESGPGSAAADRDGDLTAALGALAHILRADIVSVDPAIGTTAFESNA